MTTTTTTIMIIITTAAVMKTMRIPTMTATIMTYTLRAQWQKKPDDNTTNNIL